MLQDPLILLLSLFLDNLTHTHSLSYHLYRDDSALHIPPTLSSELQTHVPHYLLDMPTRKSL